MVALHNLSPSRDYCWLSFLQPWTNGYLAREIISQARQMIKQNEVERKPAQILPTASRMQAFKVIIFR
jgi:hypothetical protein